MLPSTVVQIKENLLFILDEVIKSRQYLNKHFQNSMNNYFLENYATSKSLKIHFDTQSGRQVRKQVFEKYSVMYEHEDMLKCFMMMKGFAEEHRLNKSLDEYREALVTLAKNDKSDCIEKGSQEWISLQWRRLFSLMVLHHTYYLDIQGVYELWFHVFNERLIAKEKQKNKKDKYQERKEIAPYITLGCATNTNYLNLETTPSIEPAMIQVDPQHISYKKENIPQNIKPTEILKNSSEIVQKRAEKQKTKSKTKTYSQKNIISEKGITSTKQCDILETIQEHNNKEEKIDYGLTKKRKTQDTIKICKDENENLENVFLENSLSLPGNPPTSLNSRSCSDLNQTLKEETQFDPTNSQITNKENFYDLSPSEGNDQIFQSTHSEMSQHIFPCFNQQNSDKQHILSYQQQTPALNLSQRMIPKQLQLQQYQGINQQKQCYSSPFTKVSNYQDYSQMPSIPKEFQQFDLEPVIPQQQHLLQQQLFNYSPSPITNQFPPFSSPQPIEISCFAPLFTLADNASKANNIFHYGYSQNSITQGQFFQENSSFPNLQIENWMYNSQLGFSEEGGFSL